MELWKSKYLIGQLLPFGSMKKRFEMAVVIPVIMDPHNLEVRPVLQQFVPRKEPHKRAYIDIYYPDLKLAVEIDEHYHDLRQSEDAERQTEIENILGCEFVRIDAKVDNFNVYDAILKINGEIQKRLKKLKSQRKFKKWYEPPTNTLANLQERTSKTILMKTIKDESGAEVLPFNQISQDVRNNAEQVLAFSGCGEYHGALIGFAAFTPDGYAVSPDNPTMVSPTGSSLTASSFLNSYIDNWNGNRNVMYSNDLLKLVRQNKS